MDGTRNIYWQKVVLMLEILKDPSYEWVVWMDADTLIMDLGIRLEDFIDEKHNFVIAENYDGINSGVFFVRNCAWSKFFLESVFDRTDCLNHYWPEQVAISKELENPTFTDLVKVVPAKFFNSLPLELAGESNSTYSNGDFIVHFASGYDRGFLKSLFNTYGSKVRDSSSRITLDQYLRKHGFNLCPRHLHCNNEGYMSDAQKKQFQEELKTHPEIKYIAEIGLNGGHSADNFFNSCKGLKKLVSFDLNEHAYTAHAVNYFRSQYPGRFEFVEGNSLNTVPHYSANFPDQKFDLIYIDGGHTYENCLRDIINCRELAHPNTIVWVDDYVDEVKNAGSTLENKGFIEVKSVKSSTDHDGLRCFAIIQYTWPSG